MNEDSDLWATIPPIASAVFVGISSFLALYIIFRDKKKSEREEAAKVICWVESRRAFTVTLDAEVELQTPGPLSVSEARIRVHNRSDYPILNTTILGRPMTRVEVRRFASSSRGRPAPDDLAYQLTFTRSGLVAEGTQQPIETAMASDLRGVHEFDLSKNPNPDFSRHWVLFTDHAGRLWCREPATAELLPLNSRKAIREIRGRRTWAWWEKNLRLILGVGAPWYSTFALSFLEKQIEFRRWVRSNVYCPASSSKKKTPR